jgi:hypothetical protein
LDEHAIAIYSYFKAACYFLPLLGGFLADRYFGKYWTIVGFSLPYVLGHFVLGIETEPALFLALVLLACGSGVIKPNISTLMGKTYDQKRPGQKALLTSAFLWFYFSINVGATLSLYALPQLRDHMVNSHLAPYQLKEETSTAADGTKVTVYQASVDGVRKEITKEEAARLKLEARSYAYPLAFQIPAWLMVAALGAFALGKRFYAVEAIDRNHAPTPEERMQRWQVLTRLFGIFGLLIFFWVAYEQNDNLWTFFARDHIAQKVVDASTGKEIDTCVLRLGSWEKEFPPDGFQFINSDHILGSIIRLDVAENRSRWNKVQADLEDAGRLSLDGCCRGRDGAGQLPGLRRRARVCLVDGAGLFRAHHWRNPGLRHGPGAVLHRGPREHEGVHHRLFPSYQYIGKPDQHAIVSALQENHSRGKVLRSDGVYRDSGVGRLLFRRPAL